MIAVLCAAFQAASLTAVYAQNKDDEITSEEKTAATALADRFMQRLDETGNIEPLIKEMFVSDFMQRYVKAAKHAVSAGNAGKQIGFSTGLYYDPSLLGQASDDDWQRLYIADFNFMQYGFVVSINEMAKYGRPMTDAEQEALDCFVKTIYPRRVTRLFDGNPILKDLFDDEGGFGTAVVKNADDLRSVYVTLNEGNDLLFRSKGGIGIGLSGNARRVLADFRTRTAKELAPNVELVEAELYGFPKGTRFISIFASATHYLLIVKLGNEYRILSAQFSSPD